MQKDKPDFQDAELTLRLYELRRETVMRTSRNAMFKDFWPQSYEDILAVSDAKHPLNAAFRQVSSYWEMVYGMAKHGICHAEYLLENSGEGLFLYAKVLPYLEQFRKEVSPTAFQNAEWITTKIPAGAKRLEGIQARVKAMAAKV
jgi:hypothetical protein